MVKYGYPPGRFGYIRRSNGTYAPHPAEIRTVKLIIECYQSGLSFWAIAASLRRHNMRQRDGKSISPRLVQHVIQRSGYYCKPAQSSGVK
ncbi:recombinase family protein [bacterium]|nr:recombinase family protein [bacterium]